MAKSNKFIGNILHCNAVRLRATGSGNLQLTLWSLDDVNSDILPNITLSATTNKEPVSLANFREQRIYLEGKVTLINERFNISRIIIFVKPTASGYPQV